MLSLRCAKVSVSTVLPLFVPCLADGTHRQKKWPHPGLKLCGFLRMSWLQPEGENPNAHPSRCACYALPTHWAARRETLQYRCLPMAAGCVLTREGKSLTP